MQNDSAKEQIILFLDICAKIEGLCARLYHYYSDIFSENHDVSRMWKKTALDEENHQKQFELAYRLKDSIRVDLNIDPDRPYRIHKKLNKLLEHVQQTPPDIVTALIRAIEMEESLVDLHLESSVSFHDESIRKMFQALREFDQDHVRSLQHCLSVMMLPRSEMAG